MRNLFILILNLLLLPTIYSQDCDYEVNTKDEFNGEEILLTNTKVVDLKGKDVYLQLSRTNSNYLLTMKYVEGATKGNDWFCSQYDPLYIIFDDGTKLTLEPNASYRTEFNRMDQKKAGLLGGGLLVELFGNKFVFSPSYILNRSNIQEFQTKKINKFRITATGRSGNTLEKIKDIEFDVKEDVKETIVQNSKCIVKGDVAKSEIILPKDFPINSATNKIAFDGVKEHSGLTANDLYEKAKEWSITYYKSKDFILNNNGEKLMQNGSFSKMFKKDNNKNMEANEFFYVITLFFKNGKYKYELTDFVVSDGKERVALDEIIPMFNNRPAKKEEALKNVFEGVTETIESLENWLSGNTQNNDDW